MPVSLVNFDWICLLIFGSTGSTEDTVLEPILSQCKRREIHYILPPKHDAIFRKTSHRIPVSFMNFACGSFLFIFLQELDTAL